MTRMRTMRSACLVAVVAALASPAAVADVRHPTIPEALWGSWAPGADDCKKGSKSLVVVAGKTYASSDGECTVAWVSETAGTQGSIYSARLACPTADGKRKSASDVLLVPKGTDQLSIGTHFRKLADYRRCPRSDAAVR
jgi:hypothetical protein